MNDPQQDSPLSEEIVADLIRYADQLRDGQPSDSLAMRRSAEALFQIVHRLEHRTIADSANQTRRYDTVPSDEDRSEIVIRPGTQVDRFELQDEVGRGGFGIVYRAMDLTLKRCVAIKIPRYDTRNTQKSRLQREAQIVSTLDHPGICRVYEARIDGRIPYIVSQLCEGPDLRRWLAETSDALSHDQIAILIAHLAGALSYAHTQGVLHRDIKPGNILLFPVSETEAAATKLPFHPRLTDFGLASANSADWSKTRTSVVLGTPMYMAPECLLGGDAASDAKADIYGLGAVMYELLTGGPAAQGDSFGELFLQITREAPPLPHQVRAETPTDLSMICGKCLRKEPDERYRSAAELQADLSRFIDGKPVRVQLPSLKTRFLKWRQRPERLRFAGRYTFWFHLMVIGWLLGQMTLVLLLGLAEEIEFYRNLTDIVLVSVALHLPKAWLGMRVCRGSRWAFWPSAISSGLCTVMFLGSAFFESVAFEYNYPTPLSKIAVFALLIGASGLGTLNYAFAWLAHRRHTHR